MKTLSRSSRLALPGGLSMVVALAACGGGGGDSETVIDPPGTLRGSVVVNGPVRNAVVCMDLNDNGACDSAEPVSAATGSNGAYVLTYDTTSLTAAQVSEASLIAPQLRGVTIDSADGLVTAYDADYVLRQVPGRAGQINPLTTLLAKGMADGMTEAEARENIAIQLGISAGKIDGYQADPVVTDASAPDSARTMAAVVAYTLEQGVELNVGRQTEPLTALGAELRRLVFTDLDNFSLREFVYDDKAEGVTGGRLRDRRVGESGGAVMSDLYNQAYLSPAGWVRCDDVTTPLTFTLGVPNRSVYCNAVHSVGVRTSAQDVGGSAMTDVVNALQADGMNFINPATATAGLLAALGSTTFPAGSAIRTGFSLDVNQPVYINSLNTDAQPTSRSTLEQLVAGRPTSGVDLSNAFGTLSLGGYTVGSTNHGLRVAFQGTGQDVQYYTCEANADFSIYSNCAATAQGTYRITTENGARVMRFLGQPEIPIDNVRLYVEVKDATQVNAFVSGDRVYQARQNKPHQDFNYFENKRLNSTGWAAMKAQLGL